MNLANIDKGVTRDLFKKAAAPAVSENYEYYEIRGDNERDLRRQMSSNGTKWDDGKTYDSVTSWNVRWDYDCKCTSAGCTADSFTTSVDITFRFPKWVKPENAPDGLVAKWNGYMSNLITHENGHRDLAVQAAADLCQTVSELPPAASQEELDREIEVLTKKRTAKLSIDEKEYDATTVHGTTQGAVFP